MELQAIDLTTLQRKGISKEQLEEELKMLKEGFPFLKIYSAATIGKGIMALSNEDKEKYIKIWNEYQQKGGKVVKMVPASGAASRMFKDLFSFANGASQTPDNDFIKHIHHAAMIHVCVSQQQSFRHLVKIRNSHSQNLEHFLLIAGISAIYK